MTCLRRALAVATLGLVAACNEGPSGPKVQLPDEPSSIIDIAVAPDPTLVTFNSASCTLTNSSTGAVSCSWNISNPSAHTLNLWAQAILTATYNCVNPNNGRIASTETRQLETLHQSFGVNATTLTGTGVALPLPFLPTDLRGQQKKQNACKGQNEVVALSYALAYWDVSVITTSGTLRFSCFASDNRLGCFT